MGLFEGIVALMPTFDPKAQTIDKVYTSAGNQKGEDNVWEGLIKEEINGGVVARTNMKNMKVPIGLDI